MFNTFLFVMNYQLSTPVLMCVVGAFGQGKLYTVELPCPVICPSVPVQYTCTANGSVIVWTVRDSNANNLGSEVLLSNVSPLNEPVQVGESPFSAALTMDSGSSGIASVITSNGMSNISGYQLQCQTTGEVTASCTIVEQGEFGSPKNDRQGFFNEYQYI